MFKTRYSGDESKPFKLTVKGSQYFPQMGEVIEVLPKSVKIKWPNGDVGIYNTQIEKGNTNVFYHETQSGTLSMYIFLQVVNSL